MTRAPAWQRWWIYQRERFPIVAHGLLIVAFSLSAVCYSSLLRGHIALPNFQVALTAFVSCLLFFLLLRVADEFKDLEDDRKYRPYRPVPRGLVTLRELGVLAVIALAIQLALALWLEPLLVLPLIVTWAYLGLMSKEFFVPAWLKARPFMYLWTHMLILPFIDFYATACDWLSAGVFSAGILSSGVAKPSSGLVWFVLMSFFNGIVVEIGRKLRAPEAEEKGVETYSALYGPKRASLMWLAALLCTGIAAFFAARTIGFMLPVTVILLILLGLAGLVTAHFWQEQSASTAQWFERLSGLWTLCVYVLVGIVPLLWQIVRG
jgi:4-hydroxybenzoate polyprenyltransferase